MFSTRYYVKDIKMREYIQISLQRSIQRKIEETNDRKNIERKCINN
jgi:hypothetical protein